ncbi:MAG: TonB-dependent receptor [Marinilabiliales bacterium]|nr:MAG: TonB-dependent receptor [Marinilabiliales bacterium]
MRRYISIIISILCFIIYSNNSFSQQVKIKVYDYSRNPLIGATVSLTNISDSTQSYATTDIDGIAIFKQIEYTVYSVKISYIGYETLEKALNIKEGTSEYTYKLKESAYALNEVTIEAQKPIIRQEGDKMIVDPENLANISSNTLEVLESTPCLFVDQDNGIYLNSATPAKVYINGREQKMSNQDISIILQSLPPGSVEKIEIMRTPSTKYDASSSGGIINIVLKKGVKIGRFGSVRAGMNQGTYGNRFGGFSINDSGDKYTTYLNANYNYNDREELLNTNRYIGFDTLLAQSSVSRQKSHQMYAGYGISYDPKDNINFNYDGRINYSLPDAFTNNTNNTQLPDFSNLAENENTLEKSSHSINIQQDLGLKIELDTIGSNLDIKTAYNYYNNNQDQLYSYNFLYPNEYLINGGCNNLQNRHFAVIQFDLTKQFKHKIVLESGLKSSFQKYSSESEFDYTYDNITLNDSLRTNKFNYTENISAAYIQASKTFGKDFVLMGGFRTEHTYMDGKQTIPNDTSFLINRIDFFPYIYLSRNIVHIMGIDLRAFLIFRRTINRPGYSMLNPSINFVDQYMYEAVNPALTPQFTNNAEFNISFNDFPIIAIGQNYTTDIFSEVIYENTDNESIIVRTYDNIGSSKETYFRGLIGIPPGGAYFFAMGAQYNLNEYDGYYQGEPLQYTKGSWRFFTFHVLRLFGNTKLTMSGFYMVNGQLGFLELENFGALNFGIRQSFLNDKLNISINARDVLRTMDVHFSIDQGGVYTYGNRYTDNQRWGIKIRYKFGLSKKKENENPFNFEELQ